MDTFRSLQSLIDSIKNGLNQCSIPPPEAGETCRQILEQLQPCTTTKIVFGLRAIASDLQIRLDWTHDNILDTHKIWTDEHTVALEQRMETIRAEIEGDNQIPDLSRINFEPADAKGILPSNPEKYDPQSERYIMLRDFLLDGLAFTAMSEREDQVTEAYNETFDWIYRDDNHTFASWLQSNTATGSMFWINGLPGSGKSTLMQYINKNKKTLDLLQLWAGDNPVTLASFFFWESGTAVQRSQAGLLRSLLYQLLSQQPDLIPGVFPVLWEKIWKADARTRIQLTGSWSLSDLSNGFMRFFELNHNRYICLLIDGLDEFEGSHRVMVDLLHHARRKLHTKLCVSSRPWNVFQESFSDIPALRLQDLTANDMVRFVEGRLAESQSINQPMEAQQHAVSDLTQAIVARANGVFLWVSLVVRTLLEEYHLSQNLVHMRQLVDTLPNSLDDLFHHLLLDTNHDSRHQMSRIFQLLRAREQVCDFTRDDDSSSLFVWEMALTEEVFLENLSTDSDIRKAPEKEVADLCQRTVNNIRGHCVGLVEVHRTRIEKQRQNQLRNRPYNPFLPRRKITFLHRTVKDYLRQDKVWNEILSHLPGLDPHLLHVQSALLQLRVPIDTPRKQRNINELWSKIVLTMTHARYALPTSYPTVFDHLNAFDDTLNWYWPPRGGSVAHDSWARSCFGTYEERGSRQYPDPFLSLATKFGIAHYVETYLETLEYEYEQEKPLLSYAVEYLVHRQNSVYPLSNPSIVDTLFKNGENPNLVRERVEEQSEDASIMELEHRKPPPKLKTPWVVALEGIQQAHRRGWIEVYDINPEGTARWARILRAFVENGADPSAKVAATYKDNEESALGLIERLLVTYKSKEIQSVRDLLLEKLE